MSRRGDDILIKFYSGQEKVVNSAKLAQVGNRFERRVQFEQETQMTIRIKGKGLDDTQLLDLLEQFLEAIRELFKSKGELQDVVQ